MMSLIVQALTAICVAPAVGAAYAASPKSDRSGAKAKRTANGCIAFRPASEADPLAVTPLVAGLERAPAAVRAPLVAAVAPARRASAVADAAAQEDEQPAASAELPPTAVHHHPVAA